LLEAVEHPAQIAGVEAKPSSKLGDLGFAARGDLVDHARFGDRERAVQVPRGEEADLEGIEPVESADGGNAVVLSALLRRARHIP
jgi:hypothetical protein